MMTNVRRVTGPHDKYRRVGDLKKGQSGYTVPWAYKDGVLDESSIVDEAPGGSVTMRVTANGDGTYDLHYTKLRME